VLYLVACELHGDI